MIEESSVAQVRGAKRVETQGTGRRVKRGRRICNKGPLLEVAGLLFLADGHCEDGKKLRNIFKKVSLRDSEFIWALSVNPTEANFLS